MTSASETAGPSDVDGSGFATLTVPNRVESIREATAFIVRAATAMEVPAASDALFDVAISEALTNAFKHGNTADRADAAIVCEVELVDAWLTIRILDQGAGFVLPEPAPSGPEWGADNITEIPERGFGLSIVRSVFPIVRTIARPGQFGLEMTLNV